MRRIEKIYSTDGGGGAFFPLYCFGPIIDAMFEIIFIFFICHVVLNVLREERVTVSITNILCIKLIFHKILSFVIFNKTFIYIPYIYLSHNRSSMPWNRKHIVK